MKTTFKDIYLPVKNGIMGNILKREYRVKDELIKAINVSNEPNKLIPPRPIVAVFQYNNNGIRLYFGKTIKEIKSLVQHIKEFEYDPNLFLNQ